MKQLAPLALAALAATAIAQDRDPTIFHIEMNGQKATEGPLGAVLMFKGKNFHLCPQTGPAAPPPGTPQAPPTKDDKDKKVCRHEDVTVKAGGQECMLLDARPEWVTFIIPPHGMSPGKVRLRLEIKGKKTVEADFTILSLEAWEKKSAKDKDAQKSQEEGAPIPGQEGAAGAPKTLTPDQEELIRAQFTIKRFEIKRDGGANRFEIEGTTSKLPDGFTISVVLQIEEPGQQPRQIETKRVAIANKTFTVIFGPYTKELLFGNYVCTLLFELGKQGQLKARKFLSTLSDQEKEIYDRVQRREYLTVGTPQEITDQKKVIQEHYLAYSKECEKLLVDFEGAYGCASRSFFRNTGGSGFDEPKYLEYLAATLLFTPDQVEKAKKDVRFATNQGHFKPKEYQEWAEKTFIPGLRGCYTRHVEFKDKYIAPLDEKADQLSDFLASIVLSFFRDWSRATYEKSKLPFPPELGNIPMNPIMAPTISKPFFHEQRRRLLRQVGLQALVDAEDAGGPPKKQ